MNWTGVTNTPTLDGGSQLDVYGSFTLANNMNLTYSGSLNFKSSAAGNTITTAGKTILFQSSFDGAGGEWILQDAFTATNNDIFVNRGNLNTNGQYVKCRRLHSTSGLIRSLTLGSSTIELNYTTTWACDLTGGNLTVNPGTSILKFTAPNSYCNLGAVSLYDFQFTNNTTNAFGYITGNPTAIHDVSFSANGILSVSATTFNNVSMAGSGSNSISGNNTFNNLTLGTSATTSNGSTQTINGIFTCDGTCVLLLRYPVVL
ncbi:MAG: hypothetical protein IPL42_09545 [Saprospiraceae bacterium]|nr:hypothetical protein [Saprospiraceae bacterium]